jgi:hypothetical protein
MPMTFEIRKTTGHKSWENVCHSISYSMANFIFPSELMGFGGVFWLAEQWEILPSPCAEEKKSFFHTIFESHLQQEYRSHSIISGIFYWVLERVHNI